MLSKTYLLSPRTLLNVAKVTDSNAQREKIPPFLAGCGGGGGEAGLRFLPGAVGVGSINHSRIGRASHEVQQELGGIVACFAPRCRVSFARFQCSADVLGFRNGT